MSPFLAVFLPLFIPFVLARPKPTATINPRQLLGVTGLSIERPALIFVTATTNIEPTASTVDLTTLYASLASYAVPTNASAIYASQTKAEAQELSQFFRTAESTAAAAVSSDLAAESRWQAAVDEVATYTGTSDLYDHFYPTNASAIYASQTKAEAQEFSQFFRTAEPSVAAALSSDLAVESSLDAKFDEYATYTGTSDLLGYALPTNASAIYASQTKAEAFEISQFFRTAVPTAKAAASSALAARSSFEDKWAELATYTGTSDILGFEATASTDPSNVSRTSAAAAATSTAWNINAAPTSQEHWPDVAYAGIPAAYGVDCKFPPHNGTRRAFDTTGCLETIPKICTSLIAASTGRPSNVDKWVFEYSTGTSNTCVGSYWLPASAAGTQKVPTFEQCQTQIYVKILNICFEDEESRDKGYALGRVNLVHGLLDDEDGRYVEGESYAGEQADAGAPSYQLSFLA